MLKFIGGFVLGTTLGVVILVLLYDAMNSEFFIDDKDDKEEDK